MSKSIKTFVILIVSVVMVSSGLYAQDKKEKKIEVRVEIKDGKKVTTTKEYLDGKLVDEKVKLGDPKEVEDFKWVDKYDSTHKFKEKKIIIFTDGTDLKDLKGKVSEEEMIEIEKCIKNIDFNVNTGGDSTIKVCKKKIIITQPVDEEKMIFMDNDDISLEDCKEGKIIIKKFNDHDMGHCENTKITFDPQTVPANSELQGTKNMKILADASSMSITLEFDNIDGKSLDINILNAEQKSLMSINISNCKRVKENICLAKLAPGKYKLVILKGENSLAKGFIVE